MLVGSSMVDQLGMESLKHLLNASTILDIGNDELHAVELVGMSILELKLQVVHRTLGLVKHDNFLGLILHELATNLGADRACSTRDENHLVNHLAYNIDIIKADTLALQQILNLDVLNLVGGEGAVNPSADVGD